MSLIQSGLGDDTDFIVEQQKWVEPHLNPGKWKEENPLDFSVVKEAMREDVYEAEKSYQELLRLVKATKQYKKERTKWKHLDSQLPEIPAEFLEKISADCKLILQLQNEGKEMMKEGDLINSKVGCSKLYKWFHDIWERTIGSMAAIEELETIRFRDTCYSLCYWAKTLLENSKFDRYASWEQFDFHLTKYSDAYLKAFDTINDNGKSMTHKSLRLVLRKLFGEFEITSLELCGFFKAKITQNPNVQVPMDQYKRFAIPEYLNESRASSLFNLHSKQLSDFATRLCTYVVQDYDGEESILSLCEPFLQLEGRYGGIKFPDFEIGLEWDDLLPDDPKLRDTRDEEAIEHDLNHTLNYNSFIDELSSISLQESGTTNLTAQSESTAEPKITEKNEETLDPKIVSDFVLYQPVSGMSRSEGRENQTDASGSSTGQESPTPRISAISSFPLPPENQIASTSKKKSATATGNQLTTNSTPTKKRRTLQSQDDPPKYTRESLGPFHCQICNKIFDNFDSWRFHVAQSHAKKLLQCRICQKICDNTRSFRDHVRSHDESNHYMCGTCNKTHKTRSRLYNHQKRSDGHRGVLNMQGEEVKYEFECKFCHRHNFKSKLSLVEHEQNRCAKRPAETEKIFGVKQTTLGLENLQSPNIFPEGPGGEIFPQISPERGNPSTCLGSSDGFLQLHNQNTIISTPANSGNSTVTEGTIFQDSFSLSPLGSWGNALSETCSENADAFPTIISANIESFFSSRQSNIPSLNSSTPASIPLKPFYICRYCFSNDFNSEKSLDEHEHNVCPKRFKLHEEVTAVSESASSANDSANNNSSTDVAYVPENVENIEDILISVNREDLGNDDLLNYVFGE